MLTTISIIQQSYTHHFNGIYGRDECETITIKFFYNDVFCCKTGLEETEDQECVYFREGVREGLEGESKRTREQGGKKKGRRKTKPQEL